MSYSWTPTTGLSDPNILDPIASPAVTTTYTITVTDNLTNETATDEITVFVNESPTNSGNLELTCDAEPEDLNQNVSPLGGTFYNQNLVEYEQGIFDPSNYEPGVYYVFYAFGEGDCQVNTNFTITIQENTPENLGDLTTCYNAGLLDLNPNVSPAGGTFTIGANEIIGGQFDPAAYGQGSYTIEYTVGVGSCAVSTFFTVEVTGDGTVTHPTGLTVVENDGNDGLTLTGANQFLEDLVIEDGATYTLSNAQVQFAEGKGIKIHAGGRLYIENNSHLSALSCEGTHWLGIRVHGNSNYSQYGSQANLQGRCHIENSTIENAIIGMTNYALLTQSNTTGGIIECHESTFKNCETSVRLETYHNYNSGGSPIPIRCRFYNSSFIWDEDFQFIHSVNNPMMYLHGVTQVKISGCDFTNTHPDIFTFPKNHRTKAAIYGAFKASIDMSKGCNGAPPYAYNTNGTCQTGDVASKVEGFNYGVVMLDGPGSEITETDFKCYRGIWAVAADGIQITQNNFNNLPQNFIPLSGQQNGYDPTWQIPYGVYMNGCASFWVEDNTFDLSQTNPSYPSGIADAGLFIRSSGAGYNVVYDNVFRGTELGSLAYDDNRGINASTGLKYECNSFDQNNYAIVAYPSNFVVDPDDDFGISASQGVAQTPTSDGNPTGNQFITPNLYDVYNVFDEVNYFHHESEDLSENHVGINDVLSPISNGCPSSFPSPWGVQVGFQAGLHRDTADSLEAVLETLIDGGNTAALTNEVVLADYGDAVELYYDLMQVSPNLSEAVMLEAINKEYELPAALLALILNSNPHAAKSGKVQDELDNRLLPLDEYQRAMIDEGLEVVSYKEKLESQESYHRNKYNFLLNQVIHEILTDSTEANKIGAIESAIVGFGSVDHYYLIIDLHVQAKKISAAQAKLNAIETDFNLDPRRDAEYADFIAVYNIIFDKALTGTATLTPAEFSELEDIAIKRNTLAASKALVTLSEYADYEFVEVLVEPDLESKSNRNSTRGRRIEDIPILECKIYPNPTAGILMVEVPSMYEEVHATLRDTNGKPVHQESNLTGMAPLNLRHLSSGNYILELESKDGTLHETHSIQIAR